MYQIGGELDKDKLTRLLVTCGDLPGIEQTRLTLSPPAVTFTVAKADVLGAETEARIAAIMAEEQVTFLPQTRVVFDADEDQMIFSHDDVGLTTLPKAPKKKRVPLFAAVSAMVTAVVLSVLLTFSLTASYMKADTPSTADPGQGGMEQEETVFDQLEFLDRLFRSCSVDPLDEDFPTALLKAYVAATGDVYAKYFTDEELKSLQGEQNGEMCGIGVTVVNGTCLVGGIEQKAIVIANVYPDSPAEEAGVLLGDYIMYVGIGDEAVSIASIGYTEALDRMSGEEGTTCSFIVYRYDHATEAYKSVEIEAVRRKLTTRSVTGRVYTLDPTVGIIKMTGFDHTTRPQFDETVQELQKKGCTSFVLDLRDNPGGLLTSVEDVLTYFLREGDTIISVKDNTGVERVTTLKLDENGRVLCGSGEMTRADVGKYRDLNFTVLVSEYSASAAELFTANMRDHKLAAIVGTTTYGKGCMQSTISLARYGYEGALKLTTAYYYPPSGIGYHDIGIVPDVEVALSEEAKKININLLTDEQDNQLAAAVKALKPAA